MSKTILEEILSEHCCPQLVGASCLEEPCSSKGKGRSASTWAAWASVLFFLQISAPQVTTNPCGPRLSLNALLCAYIGVWTWTSLVVLVELCPWHNSESCPCVKTRCVSANNTTRIWPFLSVHSFVWVSTHIWIYFLSYMIDDFWGCTSIVDLCHRLACCLLWAKPEGHC